MEGDLRSGSSRSTPKKTPEKILRPSFEAAATIIRQLEQAEESGRSECGGNATKMKHWLKEFDERSELLRPSLEANGLGDRSEQPAVAHAHIRAFSWTSSPNHSEPLLAQ